MVIIDECHHGASHVFENVLRQINSKYIYGVSANDKRIEKQSINHYVYPRFTRIMALGDSKMILTVLMHLSLKMKIEII